MDQHRSPGFTAEDQRQGVQAKRKSAEAIRRQQRRQRELRRAFEGQATTDAQEFAS